MFIPEGWTEPTKMLRMQYSEWLGHANVTDDQLGPDNPHWYFRLIGCGETGPEGQCDAGSSEYLYDELPFFQPTHNPPYIIDPTEQVKSQRSDTAIEYYLQQKLDQGWSDEKLAVLQEILKEIKSLE